MIEAFDLAIPEKGSGKTFVTVTLDEVQLKTTAVKARSTVEWGDEFVL